MSVDTDIKGTGLRGIKVAESNICLVDGQEGNLFYRGHRVDELAESCSFEEVVYLLLYGSLPTPTQLEALQSNLVSHRALPKEILDTLSQLPKRTPPMGVLQSMVPLLEAHDPEMGQESKESIRRQAVRLVARLGSVVATWERIRNGKAPVPPDPSLSHAANFLYMQTGQTPSQDLARIFDVILTLHAEHSFNASTFTARVVASTGASVYASAAGAIGSLSGKFHGGANEQVLRSLTEIGDESNVETWVQQQFAANQKIMGLGHAVYKTVIDPRAKILNKMAASLLQGASQVSKLLKIAQKLEKVALAEFQKRRGRGIYPNVDFYSAPVYAALGMPAEVLTPIFAAARVAGWTAHALEQQFPDTPGGKAVIYRPSADYVGDYCGPVGCDVTPIEKRTASSIEQEISTQVAQQLDFNGPIDESIVNLITDLVTQEFLQNQEDPKSSPPKDKDKEPASSTVFLEKRLVTQKDLEHYKKLGSKELYLGRGCIVTPLAKDKANQLGIRLVYRN